MESNPRIDLTEGGGKQMSINDFKNVALGLAILALTACASSSVLVGNARPPIEPEDVKVYLQPPAGYETVALLEASDLGANGFSAQSRMNKVMNRLKDEAAELGANGILLQGIDTQYTGSVNSGYANATVSGNSAYATGVGYSAAQFSKVGRAIAIYVPSIPPASSSVEPNVAPPVATPPTPSPAVTPTETTQPVVTPATNGSGWQKWGQGKSGG